MIIINNCIGKHQDKLECIESKVKRWNATCNLKLWRWMCSFQVGNLPIMFSQVFYTRAILIRHLISLISWLLLCYVMDSHELYIITYFFIHLNISNLFLVILMIANWFIVKLCVFLNFIVKYTLKYLCALIVRQPTLHATIFLRKNKI